MPNLDIVHEELNNNYFHRDSFQAGHVIMASVEYELFKERLRLAPEDFIIYIYSKAPPDFKEKNRIRELIIDWCQINKSIESTF